MGLGSFAFGQEPATTESAPEQDIVLIYTPEERAAMAAAGAPSGVWKTILIVGGVIGAAAFIGMKLLRKGKKRRRR